MITNEKLIERFLRYVKIDTQSQEDAEVLPSTAKQRDLASLLAKELTDMGAEVDYDEEHCYVYAKIPGSEPALGFVAHMDTAPAASGTNVKPRIISAYDGTDEILHTEEFPELLNHIGEDLIATDGTTLLGADDKAGVAEIMNLAEYYLTHPEIPHRTLWIAFTPDEEIGEGTANFDTDRFLAREAYTCDGGKLGELEYECFNAASARVEITGKSVHPGDAKNTMINACRIAVEFQNMLPEAEVPEHTEGYEGFYHLDSMEGSVEHVTLKYILRDHDKNLLAIKKQKIQKVADYLNDKYGYDMIELIIRDQYCNMAEIVKEHMSLVDNAVNAMKSLGITPRIQPIRGGTDGAALSFRGIPCPNLCTGGYNFHGRYEYASIQEMEASANLLIELAKL
ncbi:MAG: peptidase T [Eubacteriales bacterium]|nr:peptidase T [Eubacteriales bacterium]